MDDIASSDDRAVLVIPSDCAITGRIEDEVGISVGVALISGGDVGEDGIDGIDGSVDVGGERGSLDGRSPDSAVESIEVSGDNKIIE